MVDTAKLVREHYIELFIVVPLFVCCAFTFLCVICRRNIIKTRDAILDV
jgi:hypothetical protein